MRKEIILPSVAVAGGAAGFALRRWELATAFEPDTGLPLAGAGSTYAIIGFTVLMAAVLALLCRGTHREFPGGYDQAFAAKGNTLYMCAMVAAAFLLAIAGALILLAVPGQYAEVSADTHASPLFSVVPRAVLGCLSVAAGYCVFTMGKNNYKGEGHGKYASALLVPSYACCLWLIVAYQARSGDPVVLDYVWLLFAVMASVLGTYFMAGFAFERAKVFRASYVSLLGVYFCLLTLADAHEPAFLLLYAAHALYLTASTAALLFNCRVQPAGRMPRPAPDTHTEENDREGTPDEG